MIEDEESRHVAKAFKLLDEACQTLLRLMTIEPPLSYDEISELTGRPVGSLGPNEGSMSRQVARVNFLVSRGRYEALNCQEVINYERKHEFS